MWFSVSALNRSLGALGGAGAGRYHCPMTSGGNSERKPDYSAAILFFIVAFLAATQDLLPLAVGMVFAGIIAVAASRAEGRSS